MEFSSIKVLADSLVVTPLTCDLHLPPVFSRAVSGNVRKCKNNLLVHVIYFSDENWFKVAFVNLNLGIFQVLAKCQNLCAIVGASTI